MSALFFILSCLSAFWGCCMAAWSLLQCSLCYQSHLISLDVNIIFCTGFCFLDRLFPIVEWLGTLHSSCSLKWLPRYPVYYTVGTLAILIIFQPRKMLFPLQCRWLWNPDMKGLSYKNAKFLTANWYWLIMTCIVTHTYLYKVLWTLFAISCV